MNEQQKKDFLLFLESLERAKFDDPFNLAPPPANPNRNAQIGFLCYSLEDFWALLPIAKQMSDSEFIFTNIANATSEKKEKWQHSAVLMLHQLIKLTNSESLNWRIFTESQVPESHNNEKEYKLKQIAALQESQGLQNFFRKYDILVGAQASSFLINPALSHKKKICLHQNPAGWINLETLSYFDGALTTGPFSASLLEAFVPVAKTGSPRLESIALTISRDQRSNSLLYMPSSANINPAETADNILANLPGKWLLKIYVPHFRQISRHAWNQNELSEKIELYFMGEKDPARIIASADAVIIEDHNPISACLFFEKPIILFDSLFNSKGWNQREQLMPQANTKNFGLQNLTAADIGLILKNAADLKEALRSFEKPEIGMRIRAAQKKLKKAFFSSGSAEHLLETAIAFIQKIQNEKRSRESLLSRSYALYANHTAVANYHSQRFGISPPYAPITLKLLQFLMRWEQNK